MHFGEKFHNLVKSSGKTYEEIAADLNFKSRSHISYLINKASAPKHDKVMEICHYFNVPGDYFDNPTEEIKLHQAEKDYQAKMIKIPVMDSEAADAVKISDAFIPNPVIRDGFAVLINDDRLMGMGIPCGSTVFLSRQFTLSDKHRVLAQTGKNRFFATYEKRGNSVILTPANPEMPPVLFDEKTSDVPEIYAVVKSVNTVE